MRRSSEVVADGSHTYYNVLLSNNTSSYQNAVFFETRDQPIVACPSDYYASVVRVLVPTSAIPIFVFPGYFDGVNANSSPYYVSIGFNGTIVTKNVTYLPYNHLPVPPLVGSSTFPNVAALSNPYFYVYSYQQFIDAVNLALLQAFNGIVSSLPTAGTVYETAIITGGSGYVTPIIHVTGGGGAAFAATANVTAGVITSITITNAGTGYTSSPTLTVTDAGGGTGASLACFAAPNFFPPFFQYNEDDHTFSLIAQVGYDTTSENNIRIYINNALFSFLGGGTNTISNDGATNNADWYFIVENTGNNLYDLGGTPNYLVPPGLLPGYPLIDSSLGSGRYAYEMKQEYSSLFAWSSFQTLILTSGSVALKPEFAPTINLSNSQGAFTPILTDFQPENSTGFETRTLLQYVPSAEYRLLDLQSESPMFHFDVTFSWQDIYGIIHPILVPPQAALSCKIMFRKKKFNVQPLTNLIDQTLTGCSPNGYNKNDDKKENLAQNKYSQELKNKYT